MGSTAVAVPNHGLAVLHFAMWTLPRKAKHFQDFLIQTYAYSGDERFLNATQLLIGTYQYDVNIINQKMMVVCQGKTLFQFSLCHQQTDVYIGFIFSAVGACTNNGRSTVRIDGGWIGIGA